MFSRKKFTSSAEEAYKFISSKKALLREVPLAAPDIIKAAASNSVEQVEHWLTEGGDVNARDVNRYTALHYAASRDHSDVVRILLLHGAHLRGHVTPTPLALGIMHDNSRAVDALLASGDDPNIILDTVTPLTVAVVYGAVNCIPVLLKHNADVNFLNCDGTTTLRGLCSLLRSDYEFMKDKDTLLAILETLVATDGIQLDQRDDRGWTALHAAAWAGSLKAVKCLVEAGANPLIQEERGETPVDVARSYPAVKEYLLSCEGPVSLVEMRKASGLGGDVIETSIQAAACLVNKGCGATLSVRRCKPSSLNPSCPHEVDLPAGDSSSKHSVTTTSRSSSERQSSRLTLDPGAIVQKTYITLHELPNPPVISVSKKEFEPLKKTATSKREKKALRRVEKRKDKDTLTAIGELAPAADSSCVQALVGSRWLYQGTVPQLAANTSHVISPFTTIGTNHPVNLKRPARLIIPHAARPGMSGRWESSVGSRPYHITVQQMSIRDDGRGLTEWRSVSEEDVQPAEGSVTVLLRKLPLFSTFVVAAIRNTKDGVRGTSKHWLQKELEFCVAGSQYYSQYMIPRVVCFTNGATPGAFCNHLAGDGSVDRLIFWGRPVAVWAALDSDVRMKLSVKQDNWSVEPEEQRLRMRIFSSRSISSVPFLLTAPSFQSCQTSGVCYVDIPGETERLVIPFSSPTTVYAGIHTDSADSTIGKMSHFNLADAILELNESQDEPPDQDAHDPRNQTLAEIDADIPVKSRNSQPAIFSDPRIAAEADSQSSGLYNEISGKEDAENIPTVPCAGQLEEARSDADSKVDVREQAHVAYRLSANWEQLARLLSPELFTVDKIRQIRGEHEGWTSRAKAMIEEWCGHYHCKATRRLLIQALRKMGETDTADDIFGTELVQSVQPI